MKLSKKEYIIKAAKLYGLEQYIIDDLEKHLDGSKPNEFVKRKTDFLFRLYDTYNSKEYNSQIDLDENGIIKLDDYYYVISNKRLVDSKIGIFWIISSNLEVYLATKQPDIQKQIKPKFLNISIKNNFLLPQIASQMGLDATIYYIAEYVDNFKKASSCHLTKNFLNLDETLIQGTDIVKDNPKRKIINFENLLEQTDKFIRKHYKKNNLSTSHLEKARKEIREGLIKQTIFNKIVFNENESNQKWGLIADRDKYLHLAPVYSYDFCSGVELSSKSHHRVIRKNKEDIESFMLEYGDESWFKQWIQEKVLTIDVNQAVIDMERKTSVTLTDQEKEYYNFIINKFLEKIKKVCELNYDAELVEKNKKQERFHKITKKKALQTGVLGENINYYGNPDDDYPKL